MNVVAFSNQATRLSFDLFPRRPRTERRERKEDGRNGALPEFRPFPPLALLLREMRAPIRIRFRERGDWICKERLINAFDLTSAGAASQLFFGRWTQSPLFALFSVLSSLPTKLIVRCSFLLREMDFD